VIASTLGWYGASVARSDLEDSVHQWELGEALAKRAQALLDDVRAKLDAAQADQAAAGASAGTQGNMEQA
ncbi:MAG: exodeoxyribonuclease VII small subunit, partial [Parascardovia denticolens]